MRFALPFFAAALALSGCAGTSDFKPSQSLQPNEGLVLTRCTTPHSISRYVSLLEHDFKHAFINTEIPKSVKCTQEGELSLIKMKASDYYMTIQAIVLSEDKQKTVPKFSVQANKINYIGDIYFEVRSTDWKATRVVKNMELTASDKFAETMQAFKQQMPDMAGRYEVVKSVAQK